MAEERPTLFTKIERILDKSTVVLTGPGVNELRDGAQVLVLALGAPLAGGSPLVVPKAELEVTLVTDTYAIAQPPAEEKVIDGIAAFMPQTTKRRPKLLISDDAISGNPAQNPLTVGDLVVERSKLRAFVRDIQKLNLADQMGKK